MIVHMVLLEVRPDVPADQVEQVFQAIGALRSVIPGIVDYSYGSYSSPEGLQRGFTHGFCTIFTDAAARDAYLTHPRHEEVKGMVLEVLAGGLDGVLAFDYERPRS